MSFASLHRAGLVRPVRAVLAGVAAGAALIAASQTGSAAVEDGLGTAPGDGWSVEHGTGGCGTGHSARRQGGSVREATARDGAEGSDRDAAPSGRHDGHERHDGA